MNERLLGTYVPAWDETATVKVYVEAKISDGRLSVTGTSYKNRRAERNFISAGQCIDEARRITTPAPGLTMDDVRRLVEIWDRWHLNVIDFVNEFDAKEDK